MADLERALQTGQPPSQVQFITVPDVQTDCRGHGTRSAVVYIDAINIEVGAADVAIQVMQLPVRGSSQKVIGVRSTGALGTTLIRVNQVQ